MAEEAEKNFTNDDARGIAGQQTPKSVPFKNAVRLQESFTAQAERKALLWLAARMPACVNSDHLTMALSTMAGQAR